MKQFRETFNLYEQAVSCYNYDLNTHSGWSQLPESLKAAALYVQFFEQITLAWHKTQKPYMCEEHAISVLMQYIMKNVAIISQQPKRYTPNYMYTIAFNSFYPLGRIKRDIEDYEHQTTSWECIKPDRLSMDSVDDLHYADLVFADRRVVDEDIVDVIESNRFWDLIEDMDTDTKTIIDHLINGTRLRGGVAKLKSKVISELRICLSEFIFNE